MNLFKKLSEVFERPAQTEHPYNLTPGEMNVLRRLQSSEDFQVYQSILDKLITSYAEALLASSDSYTDSALKNQIAGIRKAGTFVDEVILREDSKAQDERRTQQSAADRERARRLALFSSPFYTARS